MRVDFVNSFLCAARDVLKQETGYEATRGAIRLQKSSHTTASVTAMIAVTGSVQGMVLYGMSDTTARGLVGRILCQEIPQLDELAQSGVAELANVMTGKASVKLSQMGYHSYISPPVLIIGSGTMISTLDLDRVVVPLSTEMGEIELHVALRETERTLGNE